MPSEMAYQPRSIINGAMLKQFIGKEVSIFVKVTNMEETGTTLYCKSTDDKDITVTMGGLPMDRFYEGWVEVIGKPTSDKAIYCKDVSSPMCKGMDQSSHTTFQIFSPNQIMFFLSESEEGSEPFDPHSYNMMVLFWNNCKDIYKRD
jgi:Replication factor A protein 3